MSAWRLATQRRTTSRCRARHPRCVAALLGAGLADRAAVVIGALDVNVIFSFGGSGYGVFDPDDVRSDVATALPAAEYAAAHARGAAMSYDDATDFVRAALAELVAATSADDS